MRDRRWDVLLIGGASGVGKTRLATVLSRRFALPVTAVDDFQVVLEVMTTPDQQPALHFWREHPDPGSLTAEQIHTQGLEILDALEPALRAVVEDHLEDGRPAIMEGDFIHPRLAEPGAFDGRVSGVFLCEPDAGQLVANYLEREPARGPQELRAQVGALRSRWLEETCAALGVPALHPRPWETLEARAIAAAG